MAQQVVKPAEENTTKIEVVQDEDTPEKKNNLSNFLQQHYHAESESAGTGQIAACSVACAAACIFKCAPPAHTPWDSECKTCSNACMDQVHRPLRIGPVGVRPSRPGSRPNSCGRGPGGIPVAALTAFRHKVGTGSVSLAARAPPVAPNGLSSEIAPGPKVRIASATAAQYKWKFARPSE